VTSVRVESRTLLGRGKGGLDLALRGKSYASRRGRGGRDGVDVVSHEKSCIPKQEGESGVHFGSC